MDFVSLPTALKILKMVHSAGVVQKAYGKIRKKHRFAVFGSSGTGKSNLLLSIENPLTAAISRDDRTAANRTVRLMIAGKPFVFVDTPGQPAYRDQIAEVTHAGQNQPLFRRKRFNGILNVVSYGYHEGKGDDLTKVFDENLEVKESYLTAFRKQELDQVEEWFRPLARPDRIDWIITVVTKADLWWEKRDDIMSYYSEGQYGTRIGAASVGHRVLPYCSVLHKFYEKQPLPGFLDDDGKRVIQAQFYKSLLEIIGSKLKV